MGCWRESLRLKGGSMLSVVIVLLVLAWLVMGYSGSWLMKAWIFPSWGRETELWARYAILLGGANLAVALLFVGGKFTHFLFHRQGDSWWPTKIWRVRYEYGE